MPNNYMYDDRYQDYYIVMEATSPEDAKIEILKESHKNDLNYLRFSTCLQSFKGRNRNRRLWKAEHVRAMLEDRPVQELMQKRSWVGEAGHPVPDTGKVTIERILTLDPLRCSHRIVSINWPTNDEVHGIIETLDEGPGTPGDRFYRNILQGIIPAFSLRSLVPQRKNADGSTDTIGPGRAVTYDRVYLPSHEEAYQDVEIPVKQVIGKSEFQVVMESYCDFITSHSDKVRSIVDDMEPAMESACYDPTSNMISLSTEEGRVFIAPEMKYRKELRGLYNEFNF